MYIAAAFQKFHIRFQNMIHTLPKQSYSYPTHTPVYLITSRKRHLRAARTTVAGNTVDGGLGVEDLETGDGVEVEGLEKGLLQSKRRCRNRLASILFQKRRLHFNPKTQLMLIAEYSF
jgi:hypothetical protein